MTSSSAVQGHVVDEWFQGKVRVRIFDDAYINRTSDDFHRSDARIADICWTVIEAARKEGKDV